MVGRVAVLSYAGLMIHTLTAEDRTLMNWGLDSWMTVGDFILNAIVAVNYLIH